MIQSHPALIVADRSRFVQLEKAGQRGPHLRETRPIGTQVPTLQGLTVTSIRMRVGILTYRRRCCCCCCWCRAAAAATLLLVQNILCLVRGENTRTDQKEGCED